ncbi:MAG: hypothetical protein JXB19_10885 [Bacteroidales bacterium]|nr:hypothetical protein [Bacteroidales bacterium]
MDTMVKTGTVFFIVFMAMLLPGCEEEFIPALSEDPDNSLKSQSTQSVAKSISIQTVYGPEQFMLLEWKTLKAKRNIVIENYNQFLPEYIVYIQNGSDGGDYMVSRGNVKINGEIILEIDDRNRKQKLHEFIIELPETSVLDVEISRRPVSYLTISIDGLLKPVEDPNTDAVRNAEEIFSEIHPVYLYLFDNSQVNPPVLSNGISAQYLVSEDNTISLASVNFSGYACKTGYLINGTMDIKSVQTGDPELPPHQAYINFTFNGDLSATGQEFPELDYYNYRFHIVLNSCINWTDYPDPATKTVLTEYDFESMSVFINNKSISPGDILDIMGK